LVLRGIEQIGVVPPGDVGVRTQSALEVILADFAKQRVQRILRQPARLAREFRRQREDRHGRFEAGAQKECDRQPFGARRRRYHPVNVRAQIAAGSEFEDFSYIDDESPGDGRRVDPIVVAVDLKPGDLVLQQYADESGILVSADALVAFVGGASGIADQFDELVGRGRIDRLEYVFRLLQGGSKRAQYANREGGDRGLIAKQSGPQLRQRLGPLVGALQAGPGRGIRRQRERLSFARHVELLAPVWFSPGMFEPCAIVPSKVGRVDHLDREFVFLGQCKKAAR